MLIHSVDSGNRCGDARLVDAYPVKFAPIVKERVWGCERWLVSAHPGGMSTIANGVFRGLTFQELTEAYPGHYLGRSPQKRFPLLIKWIEAADDLSVQVHPDDEYALRTEGDYGKTEAWYILKPGESGDIVYGHRFPDKGEYRRAVRSQTVHQYLERKTIRKDDLVYVPAGTLHAILKGTVLLEIQQTSDVTYRVYDWNRKDAEGRSRELHIEQAEQVMSYNAASHPFPGKPEMIFEEGPIKHEFLLECPYFKMERIELPEGGTYSLRLGKEGNPDVWITIEGEAEIEVGKRDGRIRFGKGEAILAPAGLERYRIRARKCSTLIRTYY